MFRSIKWRLVVSYGLLTLLTVALVGVLALTLARRSMAQQEVEYLTANAESIAVQATPYLWPHPERVSLRQLAQAAAFLSDAQVQILDAQGQVLVDSGLPAELDQLAWLLSAPGLEAEFRELLASGMLVVPSHGEELSALVQMSPGMNVVTIRRSHSLWGSRITFDTTGKLVEIVPPAEEVKEGETAEAAERSELAVEVPVTGGAQTIGYVKLSNGPNVRDESLSTMRQGFVIAAAGASLLAVVVGLLVGQGLTAPLQGLREAAGRMSGGDLTARARATSKDEIGALAEQFNQMAEQVEGSIEDLQAERDALRRFIADASHELRTPITALKSFNELMRGAAADDPAAQAEFLAESAVQLERLEWITQNLLDLSRLDAGLVRLDLGEQNAGDLLETAAAALRILAREKGMSLELELPEQPVLLQADGARLELALTNLLENAVKFGPASSHVRAGVEQDGEVARFWVQDEGPGIDPADRPHIFRRFYRGAGQQAPGSGLGLAIVQSVAQAHGGQVTVESEFGAGSRFAIELPLMQD